MKSKLMPINFELFFSIAALVTAAEVNAETLRKIELQCGQDMVAIICDHKSSLDYPEDRRQCNHNTLSFTNLDGKVFIPRTPKGFDETKTPVSMSCTQGKDGHHYVIVEFNNGPKDCIPCLTYHLFASSGRRLSADVSNRMQQFDKTSKRLGISFTQQIYIEGDSK